MIWDCMGLISGTSADGIDVALVRFEPHAALLAAEILAVGNDDLMDKLVQMRADMAAAVRQKDTDLQKKLEEI